MRRPSKPKRDANHRQIETAFRSMGCSVLDVSSLPGAALDLVIGYHGIDQRVEVKDGAQPPSARKLTPSEADTFQFWRGRRPVIISSVDDAQRLVAQLTKEASRRV